MKNIIVVFLLSIVAIGAQAQKSNIAHISTNTLWSLLPEKKAADSTMKVKSDQYKQYIQKMADEIQVKVLSYQGNTAATPAMKADMAVEIETMQKRLEKFTKEAEAELVAEQEKLLAPIRKKMQEAIDAVAKKNKYDYVLDSSFGNIIYVKNPADDILELVKKELGLK